MSQPPMHSDQVPVGGNGTIGLSRTHYPVTVLGHGVRAGIWFQGCTLHCPGCVSRDTWESATAQETIPIDEVLNWATGLPQLDGVTISGGEPFEQPEALALLVSGVRDRFDPTAVDILVYSGFTAQRLAVIHPDLWRQPDCVITGPYRAGIPIAPLRGSSNQEIYLHTALGQSRYANPEDLTQGLQANTAGEALWLVGIPQPGELDLLETRLAANGVLLKDTSWRC